MKHNSKLLSFSPIDIFAMLVLFEIWIKSGNKKKNKKALPIDKDKSCTIYNAFS